MKWIDGGIYGDFMNAASVIRHEPDRPVLAAALALGCGIITSNRRHFLPAEKLVKIWNIGELLEKIRQG